MYELVDNIKRNVPDWVTNTRLSNYINIIGNKIANIRLRRKYRALNWEKEVHDLLKGDNFNLIILDTARFDYFIDEYKDYLDGELYKAVTPLSATIGTLSETFTDFYDLTYFSAMPIINSKKVPFPGHSRFDWEPWNHFSHIVDIWDFGWDDELNTTPPDSVNRTIEDGYSDCDRCIIHYCQPHGNWIAEPKIFIKDGELGTVTERVKRGEIPPDKVKKAYRANLRLALDYASDLVSKLDGRIVVTGDHGELLGEYGIYGQHPLYLPAPELRIVPWLEVKNG